MATERLSMRQIREILRQKWTLELSHRAVARSLRVGLGTISSVTRRAQAAGLDWAQVQALTDEALEGRLYGRPDVAGQGPRPAPDCAWIHAERRRPGVTLELLHTEYLERYPDGYRYTQFCDLYRRWLARRRLSMRQVHLSGEKCFVDYAGQKPRLIDPATGEIIEAELFVAILGASNYTYAEATRTQQVPEWIASHARLRVLRRCHRRDRVRSTQERRRRALPLRARAAAGIRGVRRALRHRHSAGPAGDARDKAKVEGRGAGGRTADPRAAPP